MRKGDTYKIENKRTFYQSDRIFIRQLNSSKTSNIWKVDWTNLSVVVFSKTEVKRFMWTLNGSLLMKEPFIKAFGRKELIKKCFVADRQCTEYVNHYFINMHKTFISRLRFYFPLTVFTSEYSCCCRGFDARCSCHLKLIFLVRPMLWWRD